jgi:cyclase
VAINTAAIARPALIAEVARRFGSQWLVLSVEASAPPGRWEAYTDNGREHTGLDVTTGLPRPWTWRGEIPVDGGGPGRHTQGLDIELLRAVNARVNVPVITSGGFGELADLQRASAAGASGVAIADALHWGRMTVPEIKQQARALGVEVRL